MAFFRDARAAVLLGAALLGLPFATSEFTAYQIAAIDRMAQAFDGAGRKAESQKGSQYA